MDLEVLTCIRCSSSWNRQKTRGRKPKICPSCTPSLQKIEDDQEDAQILVVDELPPLKTKFKPGTKWQCPSCKVSIKINVGINYPPTHSCPKRLRRVLPLELQ